MLLLFNFYTLGTETVICTAAGRGDFSVSGVQGLPE